MKFGVCPAILSLFLAVTCLGCAKPAEPLEVHGTVTLDGKPLANATVGFNAISEGVPVQFRYASAITEATGDFTIQKCYPAEYVVTLTEDAGGAPAAENAAIPGNPKLAKYGPTSPLRAEVSDEKTTFKFDATSGK